MRRLGLLAVLLASTAQADSDFARWPPLDFALRLSHHRADLDYGGAAVRTSADRVALHWQERYGERLQLGLITGYTWLSQRNNPATAGRELSGYHAGLAFELMPFRTARLDTFVSGEWLYQRVDDDAAQRVVIVTREPNVRAGVGAILAPSLRLYGGVRYGEISGEQRQSGVVNETRRIAAVRETGGFAGLELRLRDDGYIRLDGETGADRRIAISFGRRY